MIGGFRGFDVAFHKREKKDCIVEDKVRRDLNVNDE